MINQETQVEEHAGYTRYIISGTPYILHDLFQFSDYSGTTVERSNYSVVLDMFKRHVSLPYSILSDLRNYYASGEAHNTFRDKPECVALYGGHCTNALLIREDWSEMEDTLAALADYPLLDEEHHSALEHELEEAAWTDYLADDFARELVKLCDEHDNLDSLREWLVFDCVPEEELASHYRVAVESIGAYGYFETGATYYVPNLESIARDAFGGVQEYFNQKQKAVAK